MPPAKLIVPPLLLLAAGALGAGVAYSATMNPKLHDVASVARMPIPGAKVVSLEGRRYGLYFGMLNAPSRKVMHIPKLKIRLVPPPGKADPEFVEVNGYASDTMVDGFTTVPVAYINVSAPGQYDVKVESPDEAGGSFSIGEPRDAGDPTRAFLYAAIAAVIGLVGSVLLLMRGLRTRSSG